MCSLKLVENVVGGGGWCVVVILEFSVLLWSKHFTFKIKFWIYTKPNKNQTKEENLPNLESFENFYSSSKFNPEVLKSALQYLNLNVADQMCFMQPNLRNMLNKV